MDNTSSTQAAVFPGQGSQHPGMADPWLLHDAGRAVMDEASLAIGSDVAQGCHDEGLMAKTEFVQPALLACGVAAFRVLEAEGAAFMGAAGHSLGEFAALVAADVIDLADALEVVVIRGRAMQRAGEERPGAMAALLGADLERAVALCDDARGDDVLVVANENSQAQVVISGSVQAIERAVTLAVERRIRAVRLNVAGAFHSPLMEPAVAPIVEALATVAFRAPKFHIAENVAGALVADPHELRELLERQVVCPVRWIGCAQALAAAGAETFVEAGPGEVLTRLAKRVVPQARAVAVGSPEAASAISSGP